MKLSFFGAARSVTGSRHMLDVPGFRLLFDCGMFQGRRDEALRRNRDLGFDPKSLGAVLLSHVVPIFGVPTPRRAQIVKLNGLSAHVDRNDLLVYVRAINPSPSTVFIVHGEEKQALSLGAAIQAEHSKIDGRIPHHGSAHEI